MGACRAAEQTCDADGTSYGPCEGEVLPSVEVCHNQVDEDCDGAACAAPLWSKLWGDAGVQSVQDAVADADGNIVFRGQFEGALPFDQPPLVSPVLTRFIAAVQGDGTPIAGKALDINGFTLLSKQGQLLDVHYSSSIELVSLDYGGTVLWSQSIPGAGMTANLAAVGADASGNMLVTGRVVSSTMFGETTIPSAGGFLGQLDSNSGAFIWAKKFSAQSGQTPQNIAIDSQDNIFISGKYAGPLLFPADPPGDGNDLFLLRLSPSGDVAWGLGCPGTVHGHALATGTGSSAILAGRFSGDLVIGGATVSSEGAADVFVSRISAAGGVGWSKTFGGSGFDPQGAGLARNVSVAVDDDGNILVATRGKGLIDFGSGKLGVANEISEFVVKLDANGQHLWSKRIGPVGEEGGCVVFAGKSGRWTLACSVSAAAIDFGTGALEGKGGMDVVVASFDP